MQNILIAMLILIGVPVLWFIITYNILIRLRNHCKESWSGIDTELKRRYDLVPNLVETVKGYAKHERETLTQVIEARRGAIASTGTAQQQAAQENVFVDSLRSLFALSEKYPDLKANTQYAKLMDELTNTEDRIQATRRFYNANVRAYNIRCEVIPSNLIAMLFHFKQEEYFEIESAVQRQTPKVDL